MLEYYNFSAKGAHTMKQINTCATAIKGKDAKLTRSKAVPKHIEKA
jgi:hypothetical protein